SLAFNLKGTYLLNLVTTLPDGTTKYDCAGLFGVTCGVPAARWRHQLRMTWTTPWNLSMSVNWRYIGGTALDFNSGQPALENGFFDVTPTDAHIKAYSYFDLAFTYRLKDRYTFRAGVNNLFDRTPPLV